MKTLKEKTEKESGDVRVRVEPEQCEGKFAAPIAKINEFYANLNGCSDFAL